MGVRYTRTRTHTQIHTQPPTHTTVHTCSHTHTTRNTPTHIRETAHTHTHTHTHTLQVELFQGCPVQSHLPVLWPIEQLREGDECGLPAPAGAH